MREELLKGLTEEQIRKLRECKDSKEILELAKAEGIELTDEQLEAVSGGICTSTPDFTCPKCGSKKIKTRYNENSIAEWWNNTCQDCGHVWIVNK